MLEIIHGDRKGSAAGRGMAAALQSAEFVREAARREDAFETDQKLAEQQLELRQQQSDLEDAAFQRGNEDRAFDRVLQLGDQENRRTAVDQRDRGLDLRERELDSVIEARDLGIDQETAAQGFNAMRFAGVDPGAFKPALQAAGESLGGSLGAGLRVMAEMPDQTLEVFRRMAPAHQQKFLIEEGSRQQQARIGEALAQVPEKLSLFAREGLMTPEEAQEFQKRIGEADPSEVQGVLEELELRRLDYVEKGKREVGRERFQQTLAADHAKVSGVLASLHEVGMGDSQAASTLVRQLKSMEELQQVNATDAYPDEGRYELQRKGIMSGIAPQQGGEDLFAKAQAERNAPMPFKAWSEQPGVSMELMDQVLQEAAAIMADEGLSDEERAYHMDREVDERYGVDVSDQGFTDRVRPLLESIRTQRRSRKLKTNAARLDKNRMGAGLR